MDELPSIQNMTFFLPIPDMMENCLARFQKTFSFPKHLYQNMEGADAAMVCTAINTTKECMVASHVEMAKNPLTRLVGLLGKNSLPNGFGLWIEPCADIHSCFMQFEFDALFLDRDGRVLHLIEAMKPFRFSKYVRHGRSVLELKAGTIAATRTQVGDQIRLEKAE